MTTKLHIRFVAAWTATTGSISVLTQDKTPNILAMSTGKDSVNRSCIHTFTKEVFEAKIPMPQETRDAVYAATKDNPVPIPETDASEVFGIPVRIQIIEAIGQEEALVKGILQRDKRTGQVLGLTSNVKRSRDTKEIVMIDGLPVYRKTKLVVDSPENRKDDTVSGISPAKPTLPDPVAGDEDSAENIGF
jgi:hypothetical protein